MNSSPDNARQPTSLEAKELPIQTYQNILNGFRLERERELTRLRRRKTSIWLPSVNTGGGQGRLAAVLGTLY